MVRTEAKKAKTSATSRHPTVTAIAPPPLDFPHEKRETRTNNNIQTNPTKEETK